MNKIIKEYKFVYNVKCVFVELIIFNNICLVEWNEKEYKLLDKLFNIYLIILRYIEILIRL